MSAATERRTFEVMSLDEWQENGHDGPNGRDGVPGEALLAEAVLFLQAELEAARRAKP